MKKIELHKKVVEKKGVLPDQVMVRVETYYRSLSGYLNHLSAEHKLRGITYSTHMLVTEDGAFFSIDEDRLNGDKQTREKHDGQLVSVHARLQLPSKDWDWYPCKWKSGRLVYTYKEQDFVEEEHELVVGEIIDIYAADDAQARSPHDATIIVSRPKQIVVEAYGRLAIFHVSNTENNGDLISDCGEYRLSGKYAASEYDEELHS
ncbi:hypothetical protein VPFG_00226 [Vibrio phage nt-1]|uniref:Uncharacterized protein n=1 Tax=Vibrio phage nt-1 TaxID=115992 RepID=R9TEN3_9CAUD|nr:hypothetical protein VPFG_00226 [Vibrio phage nt-1]AGN30226.1 hypothetical protein VPFG_00226 [Vibrio phage nt-1]